MVDICSGSQIYVVLGGNVLHYSFISAVYNSKVI